MWGLLLTIIAGALLNFAFAPFEISTLAMLCPGILLYSWFNTTPIQAFFRGLFFGISFFTIAIYWVYTSIHIYGDTSTTISFFIYLLLCVALALFPAIQGLITQLIFKRKNEVLLCLFIFPALWTLFEIARSHLFTGFPWLLLGTSQLNSPLKGLAPVFGVYGVSLAVTIISGAMVLFIRNRHNTIKWYGLVVMSTIILGSFILNHHHWTQESNHTIRVSLIQANVPQKNKWDPHYVLTTLETYQTLTQKSHAKNQLIIWPENSVPTIPKNFHGFLNFLNKQAQDRHNTLVIGLPIKNSIKNRYYNAALMLGENNGLYLKKHLVPFGEYTPSNKFFYWFFHYFRLSNSFFIAGPKLQQQLIINHIRTAAFICFETIFPESVLNNIKNNDLIIALSDDSWFDHTLELAQHLQTAKMRALETGRYLLEANNTGISAIINTDGTILAAAPPYQEYILSANIPAVSGSTPLMKWHYDPIYFFITVLLVIPLFL